jgi:peptidoglycan hydrolase-like protein with peptidoglycan-binding domain
VTLTIHPRTSWTTAPWATVVYTVPAAVRTDFVVHYEGGTPTRDTGAAAMRSIDAGHRANGWAGIGYNFVVMLDGSIWEGRGWSLVGAHCPDHNRSGIGVQIHLGGAQEPTTAALAAVCDLYVEACRRTGHALRKMGHRDGYATLCPGTLLESWVEAGMPRPGSLAPVPSPVPPRIPVPGGPAPAYPLPAGAYFGPRSGPASSVSGFYSHRADLRAWQSRMLARGWDIDPDGLYGPETASVAVHFQREKHLGIDGLIGPQTWAAAWTAPITG